MQLDPRLPPLGISVVANANASWAAKIVQYQDENESGGKHHIFFTVLDVSGKPVPQVTCVVDWVGRNPAEDPPIKVVTDMGGQANVPIFANLDIHLLNGPYFAFIEDQAKSDVVKGMGLPEKRHVNFLLTYGPRTAAQPPTTVDESAIQAAKKFTWMPINTQAALYRFAQEKNLGYPQTDEFEFVHEGASYLGQVFNLGIVFVKKGDWGNVRWVKKPGE